MLNRIKVSDTFYLDEFVPPIIYRRYGAKSIWFLDQQIITLAQGIRDFFEAPVTINNWAIGGRYINSGYRTPNCKVGALYSQHKRGAAIDVKIKGVRNYNLIRGEIIANQEYFLNLGLTTIEEDTPTWLHCDKRNTELDYLFIVPFR